jgi:hypothetical protein
MTRKITVEDFWNKVVKTNSCWLWQGKLDPKGYGRLSQHKAHRYSYELHFGAILKAPVSADQLVVRHKCDNPSCVNPEHLELGTRDDNNKDRHRRNRSKMDKLDPAEAFDIKYNLRAKDAILKYPQVSETTITRIRMNQIWKHI